MGAFLGWQNPPDREQQGGYIRYVYDYKIAGVYRMEAVIKPVPAVAPSVRLLFDGEPFSDWLPAPPYAATLDTTRYVDGSHLLSAECADPTVTVLDLAVRIKNRPEALTGPRKIWVTPMHYDVTYWEVGPGSAEISYDPNTFRVEGSPLRPRVAEPYRTLLDRDQLWASRLGISVPRGFVRRFHILPDGDVAVVPRQTYFYSDRPWPVVALVDGPRGVGTLGHAWAGLVEPDALYGISTNGRFWRVQPDGNIETLIGWRQRPGSLLPYWRAYNEQKTWFLEQLEWVGQIEDGPGRLNEPWDVASAILDGTRYFYVTDTLNHRILEIHEKPDGTWMGDT